MKQMLFMILLGSKPPGRNVEQHDFFFGIAPSLKDLVPRIKLFWPEAEGKIHIDGWREVTAVDGHQVVVVPRTAHLPSTFHKPPPGNGGRLHLIPVPRHHF